MQVVERVRRKAAVYGQDITSSSSAPGLESGGSTDGAGPEGCAPLAPHHSSTLPKDTVTLLLDLAMHTQDGRGHTVSLAKLCTTAITCTILGSSR